LTTLDGGVCEHDDQPAADGSGKQHPDATRVGTTVSATAPDPGPKALAIFAGAWGSTG